MGWRDRDWARFDDDEWSALTTGPGPAPTGHSLQARATILLAVLVSFGATAAAAAVHFGAKSPARQAAPASVTVQWSPSDLSIATTAGQICLDDVAHGHICANYPAGERPADALTRQLENRGLVVRSG